MLLTSVKYKGARYRFVSRKYNDYVYGRCKYRSINTHESEKSKIGENTFAKQIDNFPGQEYWSLGRVFGTYSTEHETFA